MSLSGEPVRWQTVGQVSVLDDTRPNIDAEVDLIQMFVDSVRITPCPEVTLVDLEHNSIRKTGLVGPQTVV
jgi:hypothetical protein